MNAISRRELLKGAASAAAATSATSLAGVPGARAAESIAAVEWGGNNIKTMKTVASKQSEVTVNWQLHAPSSSATFAKIKATWPHPGIDLLAGWDLNWPMMGAEGWAEPVTVEKVPNLANIPQKLLAKDKAGNVINIPRTMSAILWFYRKDTTPFQIAKLDDLLDSRLKGKICFPAPTITSNLQMVTMALANGGDEKNMEPAWDFIKKLAQSGNIGRVATSDADVSSSISSGETSVTFETSTSAIRLARNFQIHFLAKLDPNATGFRTFFNQEGWSVLKGGNAAAAFKFANFTVDPEINAELNGMIGGIPVNTKSKVPEEVTMFAYKSEEMEQYAYVPDWSYVSTQGDLWMKRWEKEIQPLL
ncbi:extracellular solute-binding protein [Bradyrhizobium sp. UFLA01-814]|uniref:ABC transporter substrate-binding protein n=1 Tax=Bradyrhizobium sp. UFLA01-814 TaxID=3023480 RepID=UPI00398A9393